jgi:exodeoxyribonuclease VII small subunit
LKKSGSTENTGGFEHSLKRLQQIVETLEEGSVHLEDVMKMYEEGVLLSKKCLEELQHVEVKLKKLGKEMDGTFKVTDESVDE